MTRLTISTKECADLLGKSPGQIRNMVYRRQIPYRKVGGSLAFELVELEKWLRSSEGYSADQIKVFNAQN